MAVKYEDLLAAVSGMTGTGSGVARAAAEATIAALARMLPTEERDRLLATLPAELTDDFPMGGGPRDWDQRDFVREVSLLGRRTPEQARLRAQAVLSALAEQEPRLMAGLTLPDDVRALVTPPEAGGGISGPTGHEAPLTAAEVTAALRRLPAWTGDTRALRRTIELPPENLDRVLERLRRLRENGGRGPKVRRGDGGTAELTVSTASIGAVTVRDVELAARIDDLIDAAGAGMAGG